MGGGGEGRGGESWLLSTVLMVVFAIAVFNVVLQLLCR